MVHGCKNSDKAAFVSHASRSVCQTGPCAEVDGLEFGRMKCATSKILHLRSMVCLKTVLGSIDRALLESADMVVVSPGVSIENYGISSLLQSGTRVMSELDFAAEVLPKCIKILAVITGTNGKSTVTTFAGQMICQLVIKAFVGGNLGNPLSEAAIQCLASPSANPEFQVAVVEVSSYQMEIPNTHFCPSVAVILNLTSDHLERHKTMKNYVATKSRIFSHMSFSKLAILPAGNQHLNEALKDYEDNCNVAWIGSCPGIKMDMERRIADLKHPSTGMISRLHLGKLKAIGSHNFYIAAVAAFSVLNFGIEVDIDSIGSTIALLRPPPHRMQIGMMIQKTLQAAGLHIPCFRATEEAVNYARSKATSGDTIVLCPGCASFDEFRNFEHRGKIFSLEELENDMLNTYELVASINPLITKEFVVQGALCALFLLTWHWFLFLMSIPITYYHLRLYMTGKHLLDVTEVFNLLRNEKRYRKVKFCFYLALFVTVMIRLVLMGSQLLVGEDVGLLYVLGMF
ncbi:Udp-n-acetylmuramoylalanine--d-glutamate ligase [Thalictrum thalictroides]|uniref:Udp-n-acetylmuramoylalanine--d-glutamate ligase n=1 Tax=Thalictrum thalictroides TaxID=46969 RepID=A0A7J6WDP8_THATH|nr:Udp-n-acetylmuramoylalanine--d-glutamate ligase [Thalictrum thalictroides]